MNSRPLHYQWSALPLSYRSNLLSAADFCHIIRQIASDHVKFFLQNVEIVKNGHFAPLFPGVNRAMSDKTVNPEKQDQADRHKKRLAEQLRANLMRRKEQARSRRAGEADLRNDGISAADKKADKQNDESGI